MIFPTPDPFWRALAPGSGGYLPWLRDAGSLTRRIQQRCGVFAVRNVRDGLALLAREEGALLGLPRREPAYARDVLLIADGTPVVYAHSVTPADCLRAPWRAVLGLGSRPLGGFLFQHPQVRRMPLRWRALRRGHPLHRQAAAALGAPLPPRLWARRSLFMLHGAPLLVTEVFLPSVLGLGAEGDAE